MDNGKYSVVNEKKKPTITEFDKSQAYKKILKIVRHLDLYS